MGHLSEQDLFFLSFSVTQTNDVIADLSFFANVLQLWSFQTLKSAANHNVVYHKNNVAQNIRAI